MHNGFESVVNHTCDSTLIKRSGFSPGSGKEFSPWILIEIKIMTHNQFKFKLRVDNRNRLIPMMDYACPVLKHTPTSHQEAPSSFFQVLLIIVDTPWYINT